MATNSFLETDVCIIGAGFAGLSSAYHLQQLNCQDTLIMEAGDHYGGLARSFNWHGIDCDLAPHRLYGDNQQTLDTLLGLVPCNAINRKSKILLYDKLISDPINIIELLASLGVADAVRVVGSYLYALAARRLALGNKKSNSFREFVIQRYGTALHKIFFQPYAEKLFGISDDQISAKWGEDKVRVSGIRDMVQRRSKLYFKQFYYPKKNGYGAFSDTLADALQNDIFYHHRLARLEYDTKLKKYRCFFNTTKPGEPSSQVEVVSKKIISTIPVPVLLNALGHKCELNYRSAKLVYLHLNAKQVLNQQWVYLVEQKYKINRISEFIQFYPELPATAQGTVLCAEVTNLRDFSVDGVIAEMEELDIIDPSLVTDTKVIDIAQAYPIYDRQYQDHLQQADQVLNSHANLYAIGRQAQFKHQDIDDIFAQAEIVAREVNPN